MKSNYTEEWHLSKLPTEKDFIGRQCVTPDCEGVSIRVEIYNQDGDVHNVEDAKLMERLVVLFLLFIPALLFITCLLSTLKGKL